MPKLTLVYKEQVNFLAEEGTLAKLKAISYFRGKGGPFSNTARDFIAKGIKDFEDSLTDKERRQYREILENVNIIRNPAA